MSEKSVDKILEEIAKNTENNEFIVVDGKLVKKRGIISDSEKVLMPSHIGYVYPAWFDEDEGLERRNEELNYVKKFKEESPDPITYYCHRTTGGQMAFGVGIIYERANWEFNLLINKKDSPVEVYSMNYIDETQAKTLSPYIKRIAKKREVFNWQPSCLMIDVAKIIVGGAENAYNALRGIIVFLQFYYKNFRDEIQEKLLEARKMPDDYDCIENFTSFRLSNARVDSQLYWYDKDETGRALYKFELQCLEKFKKEYANIGFGYKALIRDDGKLVFYIKIPIRFTEKNSWKIWEFQIVFDYDHPSMLKDTGINGPSIRVYPLKFNNSDFPHVVRDDVGRYYLDLVYNKDEDVNIYLTLQNIVRWLEVYYCWNQPGKDIDHK